MMKGIWFDDIHSYNDLNLIMGKPSIPPAAVKTSFVDIPGADGSIDLTEALGAVRYKTRNLSFPFSVLPYEDFEEKKRQISNLLNGKRCKIRLDKDPDYYWLGRCSVNGYSSTKNLHKITVNATVDPYKYKVDETIVDVELAGTDSKSTATGNPVCITDVSPISHTMEVKARSRNLLKPSIINVWQCNVSVNEDGYIAYSTTASSGVAYARVGRVTLKKGKKYVCKAIDASNIGSMLFWLPNTTTTIWAVGAYPYTPTEDITLDLAVYMKDIIDQSSAGCYVQLEEGTTNPTSHTPFVDISDKALNASGKNLAKVNSANYPLSEIELFNGSITGDFVLTMTNNVTGVENPSAALVKYVLDGTTKYFTSYGLNSLEYGFTSNKAEQKFTGNLTYMSLINYGKATGGSFDDIQLEVGTSKTGFEPFNGFITSTISADGTVDGVKSIYPTTTITTDADGLVVDVEYFNTLYQPKDVTLNNGKKAVVPIVECSDDNTTIEFGELITTVNAGKHKILDLQLKEGANPIKITGLGRAKFSYQEGDL